MALPTLDEFIENFALFDDWESRYGYLIDLGKALPPLTPAERVPENLVPGCTSQVWLVVDQAPTEASPLQCRLGSDALIVQGLLALLYMQFSNKNSIEIQDIDPSELFNDIGLEQHLSPNRRNGFFAVAQRLQSLAQQEAA